MSILQNRKTLKSFQGLNPKRKITSRAGIESWYPYYAGYSKNFAENVLANLNIKKSGVLLDPWNGSGTTTFVGDNFGLNSIGVDINPVAVLVASAKLVRSEDAYHYRGIIEEIIKQADKNHSSFDVSSDALAKWISPSALQYFRKLQLALLKLLATNRDGKPVDPCHESLPPFASFMMLALVKSARELSSPKKSSNPTWVRPDVLPKIYKSQLKSEFLKSTETLCQDISIESIQGSMTKTKVTLGDARNLDFIKSSSVDLVLTSPPYCTRIDYAINTSFELAALGISEENENFRRLRENLTGTTLIRSNSFPPRDSRQISSIKKLLGQIESHNSVASSTYYLKNYKQYFDDMYLSMSEIERVLRPKSSAVMVVQNSYYKEIEIDLPSLILSIGKKVGMKGKNVKNVEVANAMSAINPQSNKYHKNKIYYESVLVLEKP